MIGLKEMLCEEKERLEKIIKTVEKALVDVPEGRLRISSSKGHAQMLHILYDENNEKTEEYIRKENRSLACALAQKEYDTSVQKLVSRRLKQINRLAAEYVDDEIELLFDQNHPARKAMIKPVEKTWDQLLEEWNQRTYIGKDFQSCIQEIYTKKGERVRSKSEKILADLFGDLDIPYKYECPLYLNGIGLIYPDFTLLSQKSRKEIYWEHFGIMDNPEYSEKAIKKIDTYIRNGILPGDRLIMTFESKNYSISDNVVMEMIKKYFI